ncbi:MAG: DUF2163 domain-containing protein [Alphaproteobacteria bacterium]
MKPASANLAAHLAGEVTTLCTCWTITRTDGLVLGFTDHDRDVTVGGMSYRAAGGYSPSAVASSASLAVDNLDVDVVLDDEGITDGDLRAGLYDHAEVEVMLVNWAAPTDGGMVLSRGHLGEVALKGAVATAEIRGLVQALATNIGEYFSADCRASLGDARCGVDLTALTVAGAVTAVMSRRRFTAAGVAGAEYVGGMVAFSSGACAGLRMEVKASDGADITLFVPVPREIAVGDSFTIHPGCDRTAATCRQRYDNIINFRGEPFVPGQDRAMDYPNARSG